MNLSLAVGDITDEQVEVIVNAANRSLTGGGGVDGAIHRAAGPQLLEECRRIRRELLPDGLPVGDAIAMPGYALPARWVIATVGPVWSEPQATARRRLLASAYRRSLEVAGELGATSVAFPAISTGAYGWPFRDAARVALDAVTAHAGTIDDVRFVLSTPQAYEIFAAAAS